MPFIKFNRAVRYADEFPFQPQVHAEADDVLEVSDYVARIIASEDNPHGVEVDEAEAATFQNESGAVEGDEVEASDDDASSADAASTDAPVDESASEAEASKPLTSDAMHQPSQPRPDMAKRKAAAKRGRGKGRR